MKKIWGDKRYHSLNYFLREKFGEKVFKISLDAGFSCPNRDGTISRGGCIFCSERGSGDFAGNRNFSITHQFNDIKDMMMKKWKSGKYIAYFQAYTNTYAPIDVLREKYSEAIEQEGVVALAIATRPDCLSKEVLDLLEEFNQKVYVWVELGLQTSKESTAKLINRGYELPVFEKAVKDLRERGIDVVVHTIFGLPQEKRDDMIETIRYLSSKDIQGIKIHLLHLMKDTLMVRLYENGQMNFMSQEDYIELISKAISLLPPEVVVHRITGDAPRDLLIEPQWSLKKWEVLNAIDKYLEDNDIYQGKEYIKE
ncbi:MULTISPECIES: TIGR01212 family radical SAM protein [Clostridium]|uniref:Radical SAM core domain-containing protein n=1 Tax=Clostridium cadaveris TaxID=1529 RepID=A0A1I2LVE2_9CLOT|nr:TIGR01212 family radical SAM protein [Clostridium cadaveris]MDU4953946.1 TIGR01212 family radical SAM protein [Clostridium sp.]MDM8310980.1 TIGR01212 family radical SAM protein [Clostridium cadaveris]MDY4948813.1 TIGR01212 family radical SAM protein [Clostridium cadaveris]NME63053.1 TIGR01212 family radical SAM protein [Clostridium cadaveris]NWK10036.1 TIGR01212 family radical SAM protein [Clostridium cadaveris]